MSYEAGSSAYVQTTALTGKVIADDQYQAEIGVEPYTKELTASANVSNTVIVSGGKVIGAGGAAAAGAQRLFYNVTVSNGGILDAGNFTRVNGLTVESGGSFNIGGNIAFSGTLTNVAVGCLSVAGTKYATAYIENGVIYNITTNANAFTFYVQGGGMSNCTATGMNTLAAKDTFFKNVRVRPRVQHGRG